MLLCAVKAFCLGPQSGDTPRTLAAQRHRMWHPDPGRAGPGAYASHPRHAGVWAQGTIHTTATVAACRVLTVTDNGREQICSTVLPELVTVSMSGERPATR